MAYWKCLAVNPVILSQAITGINKRFGKKAKRSLLGPVNFYIPYISNQHEKSLMLPDQINIHGQLWLG
jgi:hypothetical protein